MKDLIVLLFCLVGLVSRAQFDFGSKIKLHNDKALFSCGSKAVLNHSFKNLSSSAANESLLGVNQFGQIRKLKIAIVATGEYSQYFIRKNNAYNLPESQQKKIVLNAINVSLSAVNEIFRRDLMIEFELVQNNERLIFLDPITDGLNPESSIILISELSNKINSLIDSNDYDIAHAFSTVYGGLSVHKGAFNSQKAKGVTGAKVPEGKIFNIDFFAHELGHQLGATHTQNSDCNRNPNTSIEAGSGVTIMSYAGVCNVSNSNIAVSSLPYFHDYSIRQINKYVNQYLGNPRENSEFDLDVSSNYLVPKLTPFEINLQPKLPKQSKGFYSCSQIDTEIAPFPPLATAIRGPVFTAQELSSKPVFCFPKLEKVLAGNFNSKQGVLSNVARTYSFLTSFRGESGSERIVYSKGFNVRVVDAEPLVVTSQNEDRLSFFGGQTALITWNVGGSKSVLNYDEVEILLSDNNGASFDYILSKKTANDGSERILFPSGINSNNCRVKVKPLNGIFYSINTNRFSLSSLRQKDYSNISSNNSNEIIVNDTFKFSFLEVSVNLKSNNLSKTVISLINPEGKKAVLWDGECSFGASLNVRFSDEVKNNIFGESFSQHKWVCDDVVLGLKISKQKFTGLGEVAKGNWVLAINDKADNAEVVKLNRWELHFFSNDEPETNVSNINSPINIYPNPIRDLMKIDVVDPMYKNGKLEIYTISGILKKVIRFSGSYNNEIYLTDIESGTYMACIISNGIKFTKKIVVE